MGKSFLKHLEDIAAKAVGDEDTVANILGRVGVGKDDAAKIAGHVSSAARDFGISPPKRDPARQREEPGAEPEAEAVAEPAAAEPVQPEPVAAAEEPEAASAPSAPARAPARRNRNMTVTSAATDPMITQNFPVPAEMRAEFQRILGSDDPESALAMVGVLGNSSGSTSVRENIGMFVAGSGADACCLFFRSGEGRSSKPGVHVPSASEQQAVLKAAGVTGRADAGALTSYLSSVVNNQAAWADYGLGTTRAGRPEAPGAGLG